MKKDELTALGLTGEQVDAVFALHGKDLEKHKGAAAEKAAALDAANQTIAELQAAVKQFDGVDVDKLKSDLAALQTKYDADLTGAKRSAAIDMALLSAQARDIRAVRPFLDLDAIQMDGDKLTGLEEQLARLKEDKGFLFGAEERKPVATVSTGQEHGDPLAATLDKFSAAALKGAGIEERK